MDRVKWNDFMEILSDDLDRSGEYLINGFQDMVSDFITNEDATVGLAVTAQAVPDMSVYVKTGRLYQQGKQGTLEADSGKLTIAAAHESYARIDRIVAQYQEVEDRPETRNIMTDVVSRNIVQQAVKTRIAGTVVFQVLQGVPAAVPVPVTVPDGWIPLAKVNVPANVAQIQQSNIINDAPKLLAILNHNHNGAGGGQKISYKNLTDTPAIATQAEAEAGTENTKLMTALRVKEAIDALVEGIHVGDVVYRPFLAAGYVKANGATVNRADYPNLVAFANAHSLWTSDPTREPWKYGVGDNSTTMVLPDYRNRVIQGGDNAVILSAGLPNITGYWTDFVGAPIGDQLLFQTSERGQRASQDSGYYNTPKVTFDASKSNSIYGASTTVQPPAIVLIPQIKF